MTMFFSNRVASNDKAMNTKSTRASSSSSYSRSASTLFLMVAGNNSTDRNNNKGSSRSIRHIARFFQHKRPSSADTPCLSASTSVSSVQSSVTLPKRSTDVRSSKSIELESLIMDQPSRTVRVSITPDCAAWWYYTSTWVKKIHSRAAIITFFVEQVLPYSSWLMLVVVTRIKHTHNKQQQQAPFFTTQNFLLLFPHFLYSICFWPLFFLLHFKSLYQSPFLQAPSSHIYHYRTVKEIHL